MTRLLLSLLLASQAGAAALQELETASDSPVETERIVDGAPQGRRAEEVVVPGMRADDARLAPSSPAELKTKAGPPSPQGAPVAKKKKKAECESFGACFVGGLLTPFMLPFVGAKAGIVLGTMLMAKTGKVGRGFGAVLGAILGVVAGVVLAPLGLLFGIVKALSKL